MKLPEVTIILQTYERTEYALATIRSHLKHLKYAGPLVWYVADDGSRQEHVEAVLDAIGPTAEVRDCHSRPLSYGGSVNRGWDAARGSVSYFLEDDWKLCRDLDITPYVRLLMEVEEVGMVRLGHLPVGLLADSRGHDGRMYLNIHKQTNYQFSGNPHLKHDRFGFAYGPYPEGLNPGKTEITYDYRIRTTNGPSIWWPLAIGDNPYFAHIGAVQSYEAET